MAHLDGLGGTPVCRGTPVANHWDRKICGPHGLSADFGEENNRDPTAWISTLQSFGYGSYTLTEKKHINIFKITSKR
jgi:hypothetical protein